MATSSPPLKRVATRTPTDHTPRLIGVVHLAALPGSPRCRLPLSEVVDVAASEARKLADAGFDGVIVENFGDAPFVPDEVAPITIAAMTRAAVAVREAAPSLSLGVNVLRNDARAALAVAAVSGASAIRINVHSGARLTDQGVVNGRAHETLRRRRALGLEHVQLFCDVAVKHAAPLAARPIAEEAEELAERALADAVLVTGSGTGAAADHGDIAAVVEAVHAPVIIASGATPDSVGALMRIEREGRHPHGVIVGSALRQGGKAGAPVEADRCKRFAEAFARACADR